MDNIADPVTLYRLLLYARPATRRSVANDVVASDPPGAWTMLAATVRSSEPWLLRARCLELLGMAAADADESTAELILTTLLERTES